MKRPIPRTKPYLDKSNIITLNLQSFLLESIAQDCKIDISKNIKPISHLSGQQPWPCSSSLGLYNGEIGCPTPKWFYSPSTQKSPCEI